MPKISTVRPTLLAVAFLSTALFAADGDLDSSFQPDGFRVVWPAGVSANLVAAGVARNGQLLGAGWVGSATEDDTLVTWMTDNSITQFCVRSFDVGAGVEWDDRALAAAVQPDGKMVVAGRVVGMPDHPERRPMAMRLDPITCTLDPSFGTGGRLLLDFEAPGEIRATVIQADGKIVFAGIRDLGEGTLQGVVVRVTATGEPDSSFSGDGLLIVAPPNTNSLELNAIALDGDHIVVAGLHERDNGNVDLFVRRTLASGTSDPIFSIDGQQTTSIDLDGMSRDVFYGVVVLPDRRIVAVGQADAATGSRGVIAVYLTNGELDTGFGLGGTVLMFFDDANDHNRLNAVARQADGKLVAVGTFAPDVLFGNVDAGVVRFRPQGGVPLDTSFSGDGRATLALDGGGLNTDIASALTLGQGGRIAVIGTSSTSNGLGGMAFRLRSGTFGDGFELGTTGVWSQATP